MVDKITIVDHEGDYYIKVRYEGGSENGFVNPPLSLMEAVRVICAGTDNQSMNPMFYRDEGGAIEDDCKASDYGITFLNAMAKGKKILAYKSNDKKIILFWANMTDDSAKCFDLEEWFNPDTL